MTVLPECGAHSLAAHLPEPDIGRAGWNRGPYAVARSGHLALHRSWLLFASALAVSLLGFPPDKDECKSEISLAMIMRGAGLWARKPSLQRVRREIGKASGRERGCKCVYISGVAVS